MSELIGHVASLHRYPVKSMLGEDLDAAEITPAGLLGDRAYALIDQETGRVVSAKRPREWADLLRYRATFESDPARGGLVPPVQVYPPDGSASLSSTDGMDGQLSAALGRSVVLESVSPAGAAFEYHWPDMEGMDWEGRPVRDEVTVHEMPPGTFFDSTSVHVLASSSLDRLRELVPGNDFDGRRFRPNVVIDAAEGAGGFVENDWVGRVIRIGDAAELNITGPCMRCVMVNLPQRDLPANTGTLRATFDHNAGNVGAKAMVRRAGQVRVGDAVTLL